MRLTFVQLDWQTSRCKMPHVCPPVVHSLPVLVCKPKTFTNGMVPCRVKLLFAFGNCHLAAYQHVSKHKLQRQMHLTPLLTSFIMSCRYFSTCGRLSSPVASWVSRLLKRFRSCTTHTHTHTLHRSVVAFKWTHLHCRTKLAASVDVDHTCMVGGTWRGTWQGYMHSKTRRSMQHSHLPCSVRQLPGGDDHLGHVAILVKLRGTVATNPQQMNPCILSDRKTCMLQCCNSAIHVAMLQGAVATTHCK
jgi:hypothetical protein